MCRDVHEPVIHKVKHTTRSIDLRSQLTNRDCRKNQGDTRAQEYLVDCSREAKNSGIGDGRGHHVTDENDKNNQELSPNNESSHVVSFMG
mmetsp:Transcript_13232/g.26789  ORF Transcript_13232/g.26789 Transcript_13232/m.26789 type:complete len:90 (+) Transcript_13232:496-765(+)